MDEICGTLVSVLGNHSNPAGGPDARRDADKEARIAREALDRLARTQAAEEARDQDVGVKRSAVRVGSGVAKGLLAGLIVVIVARQSSAATTSVGGVPWTFIGGAVASVGIMVWIVIRVRREFRDRREAIKAKRAGLCTCNYPRPRGAMKCPECGGAMVMR